MNGKCLSRGGGGVGSHFCACYSPLLPPMDSLTFFAIEDNRFTVFFFTSEAPRFGVKDSHASVWSLELRLRTPT